MKLKRLNDQGIEQFANFLDSLNSDTPLPYPSALLTDPGATEEIHPAVEIEQRSFASRYEAAEYLYKILKDTYLTDIERDRGLWAWLSLLYFDEPVLLVKRFDRQWKGKSVNRIHVIDGCQILDLPPTYKYERPFGSSGDAGIIRTGASLPALFNATELCRIPAKARMDLLNWVLFQLIIGNCDAHGKNISFFVRKEGIDITPAYDMLNVDMYGEKFDRELAMAIGDEFSLDGILAFQLAEFCEECGLQQRLVAHAFRKLCNAVSANLDKLDIDILKEVDEKDFAMELIKNIRARAEYFKEISLELPGIAL